MDDIGKDSFRPMIRVSAIIATYNNSATVGRAIESALNQQIEGVEVIVVDDGSTDATPKSLAKWRDRIKIIRQQNRGPSAARNRGVSEASGAYVAFLDADDVWMPGKLAKMIRSLQAAPGAVLGYSAFTPVDDCGRAVDESFIMPECAHAPSMEELLTRWWPILTSTVVMRRGTFERCGGFSERFRSAGYEDPFLWLVAREYGEFVFVTEPLVIYRTEPTLHRMEKYARGCAIFAQLVREHFGDRGSRLVDEVVRAQVSAIGHEGLLAMHRGDREQARHAFKLALRYHPTDLRNGLRLLRTFLPTGLARTLSGRTRNQLRRDS